MPPRESSRSSTYLPKTCGYTHAGAYQLACPRGHRTRVALRAADAPGLLGYTVGGMMFRRWKLARALGCGALLAVLAGGCTKDPEIVERRLFG